MTVEATEPGPAPVAEPEKPAEGAPPADPATPVAEPPPEPKPGLVAEVMKARDAKNLAAIVREKRQLEATAAKYKEHEPKLAALERMQRLLEDGDRTGAILELHRLQYGDKAADELAASYNGLTEHILGAQSQPSPELTQVKREVSRTANEVAAIKLERDQARAALAEKEEAERERAIQGAKQTVGGFLKDTETTYPYLVAEADAPEEIVWGILEAAAERNEEMTLAQACELANEHFKPTAEKKAARYQNLFAPKPATGSPLKPETRTSPTASPRKSITNADASSVAPDQELPPPRTEQERRDRSFALLQQRHSEPKA